MKKIFHLLGDYWFSRNSQCVSDDGSAENC